MIGPLVRALALGVRERMLLFCVGSEDRSYLGIASRPDTNTGCALDSRGFDDR
jgi:hypothetical protein